MKKLVLNAAVAFAVLSAGNAWCEEAAGNESAETTNAEPAEPKRKPKKMPEYKLWQQASDVATAWEQPVVAFVGVQGDKLTSKVRTASVGNQACKELFLKNAVYYSYMIPQAKSKGRGNQVKNAPAKPDRSAVKESEKIIIDRIAPDEGHAKIAFPVIAVLDPGGKVLYRYIPDPDNLTFSHFVQGLKDGFGEGKFPLEISSKVEKVLKAEEKKRAAAEKQKRK